MGWISVNDRLPEVREGNSLNIYSEQVLTKSYGVGKFGMSVQMYCTETRKWVNNSNVTHWRPLPSAPDEQYAPTNLSHDLIDCLGVAADRACEDGEYEIEELLRKIGSFDLSRLGVVRELEWEMTYDGVRSGHYVVQCNYQTGAWHWQYLNGFDFQQPCDSVEHGQQLAEAHHFKRVSELIKPVVGNANVEA